MAIKIFSADFSTRTHKNQARFWVPKKVANMFGLRSGSQINLVIYSKNGKIVFRGPYRLKSGLEIYGKACEELIPRQLIHVQVSKDDEHLYLLKLPFKAR